MRRPSPALRRTLFLHRRSIAAALTFVAVLAGLSVLAPPREAVGVVAASGPLPAGTVLTSRDLTRVALPPDVLPDGAVRDPAALVGRTLTAPASRHTVLTDAHLASATMATSPGHVVVPVPVPAAAFAALVRPGGRLDVLGDDGTPLARDVLVVAPPDAAGAAPATQRGGSRSVLVEVTPEVATVITQAVRSGNVTLAVH